jgi:hypothetical protein
LPLHYNGSRNDIINDENRLLRLNRVKPKLSLANAMTTNAATNAAANKATSAPPGRKVPQVQTPALSTRLWH